MKIVNTDEYVAFLDDEDGSARDLILQWASSDFSFDLVGKFLSNPNEDFYQGLGFMSVIRRKEDGKLFGFEYWEDISKYGEPYIESNEENYSELDVHDEYGWYVFKPVETFTITGYKHV